MAGRLVSIDPLELNDSFIGLRLIVTTPDGASRAGGVSDVLRVEPGEWPAAARALKVLEPFAGLEVAGCVLWIGGEIVVLTALAHVVAEATPGDGVS